MMTNDQVLIGVHKPKVASGDVNSVALHVDFDAVWDIFTSKSACFHTAKDATTHEVLLINGECIVPASVLAEEGTLFIGIRGITADGEMVKTSTFVKYKVVEGAAAGRKTIYPELDMYQQYLAAMSESIKPIVEQHIEDYVEATVETIQKQGEQIDELTNNSVKIDSGTYKGTGQDNSTPNSLTFNFTPKFVLISKQQTHVGTIGSHSSHHMMAFYGETHAVSYRYDHSYANVMGLIFLNWNGNTLEWYAADHDREVENQLNNSGSTYYYIAIG